MAYGVAPYQGLCVLALKLKERAAEPIRNQIPEPLKLKRDYRRLVPCMGEYFNLQILQSSLSLPLCLSLFLSRAVLVSCVHVRS